MLRIFKPGYKTNTLGECFLGLKFERLDILIEKLIVDKHRADLFYVLCLTLKCLKKSYAKAEVVQKCKIYFFEELVFRTQVGKLVFY